MKSPPGGPRRPREYLAHAWLIAVGILWGILSHCYALRPDAFTALTIFPVWCWFLLGLVLTALGWRRKQARKAAIIAAMWLLFLLVFADEPRSLLRALLPTSAGEESQNLRVVSLNCSAGDPAAAREVIEWNPDVVLLQESPSRADVEKLARKLFGKDGGFHWGIDGSIIARGKVTSRPLPPELRSYFVQAHVRLPQDGLPQGRELEVFSLRLMTPPFRVDLWSPSSWQAYRQNRQLQHTQMSAIGWQLHAIPVDTAIIIGGDFNSPQADAIFDVLRLRLYDTFARAGRGWGNTIINDFPALRIDQIWASDALQARQVTARKTQNSDHRAVVADFLWH